MSKKLLFKLVTFPQVVRVHHYIWFSVSKFLHNAT